MKIYLETANISEIQEAISLGILDGITTNSSLVTKETKTHDLYEGLREICRFVDVPICVGGLSVEEETMVKEGKELADIHHNIIVKCPLTSEGLKATKRLTAEGIGVNVTLCCSPAHAWLAAHAGARYVSSFMGCLGNVREDEIDVVRQIVTLFHHNEISTQVLISNVQEPQQVIEVAQVGGHICAMPLSAMKKLRTFRAIEAGERLCH